MASNLPANSDQLLAENNLAAPCYFTRRRTKENYLKQKKMIEESERQLQHKETSRKRRRKLTVVDEMSRQNNESSLEPSSYFTRRQTKKTHQKRRRMTEIPEEPEPEETSRKRRRKKTGENDVSREMPESNSRVSRIFTRSQMKKNPLKRKRMNFPYEIPGKRMRMNTEESDETTENNERNSEPCCSFTVREDKKSPLRRKRMDIHHEKCEKTSGSAAPWVFSSENSFPYQGTKSKLKKTPKKQNRRNTDGPLEKKEKRQKKQTHIVRRINPFRNAKLDGRCTVEKLLGEGSFGCVYAGNRKSDGKKVAIKFVEKRTDDSYITPPGHTSRLPLEVALMEFVCKPPTCPYVIQLLEWYETPTAFILILDRPDPCTDLYTFCRDLQGNISETLVQIIMEQVVRAACHCRDRGVFHRDIKEENILLNPHTLEVKLIDFGCGDLLKDTCYREYSGTPIYFPPEWIIEYEYHAEPATVWSLGILLYSLLCGQEPFSDCRDIIEGNLFIPDELSADSQSLIKWCLEWDPQKRPTLDQVLEHPWF